MGASDVEGSTPLHMAAASGNESVAHVLLKADLHLFAMSKLKPEGQIGSRTSLCFQNSANPNTVSRLGKSPLRLASAGGHLGVVKLLLQAGAIPQLRDASGLTALQLASQSKRQNVMQILHDAENRRMSAFLGDRDSDSCSLRCTLPFRRGKQ